MTPVTKTILSNLDKHIQHAKTIGWRAVGRNGVWVLRSPDGLLVEPHALSDCKTAQEAWLLYTPFFEDLNP